MRFKVGQHVILNGVVDSLQVDGIMGTITSYDGLDYDYQIKFDHPIEGENQWWVLVENIRAVVYNQSDMQHILGG